MVLLRRQQLLHRQVIEMRQPIPDSPCISPVPSRQSSSPSAIIQVESQWIQSFERCLTAQILRAVRWELNQSFQKALTRQQNQEKKQLKLMFTFFN